MHLRHGRACWVKQAAPLKTRTAGKGAYSTWLEGHESRSSRVLAPEVAPPVVVDHVHSTLPQDVEAGRVAIRLPVIDARDVRVDGHLGAHHTRRRADEHHLPGQLRAGLDQCILLRVRATARPWL